MGRIKSKQQLLDDILKERTKLEDLLMDVPAKLKTSEEVTDGMTIKDFLAHRTEWGRMMTNWYETAKAGDTPAVPSEKYKWNQLKELNADIHKRFAKTPLKTIEKDFKEVHDNLYKMIQGMKEREILEKNVYGFTGSSSLAIYLSSATASHYRSAYRHINKWWKAQQK